MQEKPLRKSGLITLDDVESFIAYINRHKVELETVIYCNADYEKSEISFTCIFDDHSSGSDGQNWQAFKANYNPLFSEEWNRWISNDEQRLSQF
ncbi:MAG: DUF2303 family protein [Proteobacteria bacterium]|nr:DUF2303 family protein [Pseudomonadota bacterium]